jgi:hypothetical protein
LPDAARVRQFDPRKERLIIHKSFQIGDHFVAHNADRSGVIPGIILDIDKEYYHVHWGKWGKKLVPISWVESLKPWTLTNGSRHETVNEPP